MFRSSRTIDSFFLSPTDESDGGGYSLRSAWVSTGKRRHVDVSSGCSLADTAAAAAAAAAAATIVRWRNSGEEDCGHGDAAAAGVDTGGELPLLRLQLLLLLLELEDDDRGDDELLWAARMADEKIEADGDDDDSRHGGLRRFSSPKMSRTVASLLTFLRDTSERGSLIPLPSPSAPMAWSGASSCCCCWLFQC